jgi:hypothetical protein
LIGGCVHQAFNAFAGLSDEQQKQPLVAYKPKERATAPGPEEVPIKHSSSFVQQERSGALAPASGRYQSQAQSLQRSGAGASQDEGLTSGNALEWALKRADAYFDEVEGNSEVNRGTRALVTNPVTEGVLKAMQARISSSRFTIQQAMLRMSRALRGGSSYPIHRQDARTFSMRVDAGTRAQCLAPHSLLT